MGNIYKNIIISAAITASTWGISPLIGNSASFAQNPSPQNLLNKTRSYTRLNDENFGKRSYNIPAPSTEATQFRARLKGYIFGLRIMRSDIAGWFDGSRYAIYTDIKTSGLAATLKSMEIWAVTFGQYDRTGLQPQFHVQQNTDKKHRRVEMNYDRNAQNLDIKIVPPLGSQGTPPVTPAQRFSAYDTASAIMALMMSGNQIEGELCTGRLPLFDSKQRYDLRLERIGTRRVKFEGDKQEAIHCLAYYEPISGFDEEDLPNTEVGSTPVNVYFKYYEEADLYVPVRFTYKISSITAVIKVDEIDFIPPTKQGR